MAKGIGKIVNVGIAKESTRGTAPGSATFWLQKSEADFVEKRELADRDMSVGVIEDVVGADVVKQYAEGSIGMPMTDKSVGLLLFSALGSLSTAANSPESGTHTHTITVGQSAQHQSLAVYLDDALGAQDYTYALGVVTSLELDYQRGKYVTIKANLKSKKGATGTHTPSFTAENLFRPHDLTFKLATNLAGLAGASAMSIKSLNLKMDNNTEDDDVLGSAEPADFLNKQFSIEGSFEAIWQNTTDFYAQFLAGTAKAMRIQLENLDVTIGTTTHPKLTIDLAAVYFKELTRAFNVGDVVMQTIGFKATYSLSDAKAVTIALINGTASY